MHSALVMGFVEPYGEVLFYQIVQGLTKELTKKKVTRYITQQRLAWVPASEVDIQWSWLDDIGYNHPTNRARPNSLDAAVDTSLEGLLSKEPPQ